MLNELAISFSIIFTSIVYACKVTKRFDFVEEVVSLSPQKIYDDKLDYRSRCFKPLNSEKYYKQ